MIISSFSHFSDVLLSKTATMVKLLLPLSFLLTTVGLYAQEKPISNNLESLSVSSIGYANYYNDEQHSSFIVDWNINDKNALMLKGYYDTYTTGDVFKSQIIFRKPILKKLYVSSGVEMNVERTVIGGINNTKNFKTLNGIGYEVQDNLLIELMSETVIGKQNFNNNYSGSLIRLGTKLKF
ncbi:hypothetical protein H0I23_03285 [Cellulophaga sp. HaHaR_3_176]|uniref:hypothetical protein n=1 Tax=Cellulophaga sp. HaHaR_3_176 TaxID=1942464 RepID=UPI001C1F8B2D|nr:hypothetical protein [Cellulophaga sp. HaHaR_3_176]QWX84683.1 hypothetical protein H0I23_03285 [Cellulophaga sp. HaHaR_3_176]